MKTFLAQNEFISNPSVILPRTERSAVALIAPPVADATAAPIHSSDGGVESRHAVGPGSGLRKPAIHIAPVGECGGGGAPIAGAAPSPSEAIPASTGGPQEASAPAPTKNPDADALGTDHIHELFFYARRLMKPPPAFILDEARFLAEIEEIPLFIREDGYLKRQA